MSGTENKRSDTMTYTIKNNSGDFYNDSTKCWGQKCAATEYAEADLPETVPATDEDCNDTDLELVVHCAASEGGLGLDARYYADDAHECSASAELA